MMARINITIWVMLTLEEQLAMLMQESTLIMKTSNLTHEGTMILEINSINPNPANDLLLISVSIPQQAFDYGLEVRDISGRVVIDLSESILHSGHNTVSWDLRDESGTSVPLVLLCSTHH